jgi:MoxR-like ATPase
MTDGALTRLEAALSQVVVGQPKVLADLVTTFLARGHVLLEGVPGVAKTLAARTMAQALGLSFTRIQFTPDLMPTDVVGTSVFRPQDGSFQLVKGPVFTEVLVADEVNRTPPKTQAALLEAMEERQVTIDGTTHALPSSFFVVATQNPLELEGTYPLPEAQLDRFMMRVKVGYPDAKAEQEMLVKFHERQGAVPQVPRVLSGEELAGLQQQATAITCEPSILEYVVRLVRATRDDRRLRLGASPRSAQALLAAARARSALERKAFVTPDEVKAVAHGVLNHRLIIRAESDLEGLTSEDIVRQLLERVEVPR